MLRGARFASVLAAISLLALPAAVAATGITGSVHIHFKVPGIGTVCDASGTFTAHHK